MGGIRLLALRCSTYLVCLFSRLFGSLLELLADSFRGGSGLSAADLARLLVLAIGERLGGRENLFLLLLILPVFNNGKLKHGFLGVWLAPNLGHMLAEEHPQSVGVVSALLLEPDALLLVPGGELAEVFESGPVLVVVQLEATSRGLKASLVMAL